MKSRFAVRTGGGTEEQEWVDCELKVLRMGLEAERRSLAQVHL